MRDIVLIALSDEAPDLSKHPNVFHTGVGKVNAGLTAARLIERYKPDAIWNFGTAGGITVGAGLHRCTRFIQRDMLVTALGFLPGQTPFENNIILEMGTGGLVCSSGDSFVTSSALAIPADLVDMEAYAIAKACHATSTQFHCYKFISDQADESSSSDWKSNISKGEPLYFDILKSHHVI